MVILRMVRSVMNFEFAILDFIREYLSSPVMDKIMVFVTRLGDAGILWIALTLLLLCSKKHRRTGVMMAVGLCFSLLVCNMMLKPWVARLRPFQVKEGAELLIKAPRDYSFPSGHTLASVVSATVLLLREKKLGYIALVAAVLIAFSRMYLYVHFPTDILGGIILGIAAGITSVKLVNYLLEKSKEY